MRIDHPDTEHVIDYLGMEPIKVIIVIGYKLGACNAWYIGQKRRLGD